MSLIKNTNGNQDDINRMISNLRSDLISANGEPIEIFPGIAIDGYVEEGLIFVEELLYMEEDSLKKFKDLYELIDYVVIVNPISKNLLNQMKASSVIRSDKEALHVFTFCKNAKLKNRIVKYYDYIFDLLGE